MLIDTKEAAKRLNVTTMRVVQLLLENRIPGAQKLGGQRGVWVIDVPDDQPPVILPTARQAEKRRVAKVRD